MMHTWLLNVPPASLFRRIRWRAWLLTASALSVFLLTAIGAGHAGVTWLGQGGTIPPAPCFSQTDNGILLEFLGYETASDGTTTLSVRLTNPHKQPAPQVHIAAPGWTQLSPAHGSDYAGASGPYRVQWFPPQGSPPAAGSRFVAQGAHLRHGASETFRLTVRDFDPQTLLTAWTKAGPHRAAFSVQPAEHECDLRPTPTPTATATATATVTPLSPLPTPTARPTSESAASFPLVDVHVFSLDLFEVELTEAEKQARWDAGLPVPEVITIPVQFQPEGFAPKRANRGCCHRFHKQ